MTAQIITTGFVLKYFANRQAISLHVYGLKFRSAVGEFSVASLQLLNYNLDFDKLPLKLG